MLPLSAQVVTGVGTMDFSVAGDAGSAIHKGCATSASICSWQILVPCETVAALAHGSRVLRG